MRPDLFSVVVADVPFVDTIGSMIDRSIPVNILKIFFYIFIILVDFF